MSDKPTRFEDLKPTELYRSAIEDFALPVEADDKNKKSVLLAAFLEGGVNWTDYVAQHPEVAPEPEPEPERIVEVDRGNVITSQPTNPESLSVEAPVVEERVEIKFKEAPKVNTVEKYLVKMTRENPLYEVRGYRFTREHPYALVDGRDLEYILTREVGFRQALPSELEEFYS